MKTLTGKSHQIEAHILMTLAGKGNQVEAHILMETLTDKSHQIYAVPVVLALVGLPWVTSAPEPVLHYVNGGG